MIVSDGFLFSKSKGIQGTFSKHTNSLIYVLDNSKINLGNEYGRSVSVYSGNRQ
jgi:hypothetical protein